jgi:hypothetical protein
MKERGNPCSQQLVFLSLEPTPSHSRRFYQQRVFLLPISNETYPYRSLVLKDQFKLINEHILLRLHEFKIKSVKIIITCKYIQCLNSLSRGCIGCAGKSHPRKRLLWFCSSEVATACWCSSIVAATNSCCFFASMA